MEKASLSFQHSNSPSSSSSNEERSPKLPHNNGAVNTTPSGSTDPMRGRATTTTAPMVPKRSYDTLLPSPSSTLEKKRLMSDSVLCKFNQSSNIIAASFLFYIANEHLDRNDNRFANQ